MVLHKTCARGIRGIPNSPRESEFYIASRVPYLSSRTCTRHARHPASAERRDDAARPSTPSRPSKAWRRVHGVAGRRFHALAPRRFRDASAIYHATLSRCDASALSRFDASALLRCERFRDVAARRAPDAKQSPRAPTRAPLSVLRPRRSRGPALSPCRGSAPSRGHGPRESGADLKGSRSSTLASPVRTLTVAARRPHEATGLAKAARASGPSGAPAPIAGSRRVPRSGGSRVDGCAAASDRALLPRGIPPSGGSPAAAQLIKRAAASGRGG